MHYFKTNGNFSKYLSLMYSFRLKINYHDSLSAMFRKKIKKFIQSMAQNVTVRRNKMSITLRDEKVKRN